jgi:hypothetical protein
VVKEPSPADRHRLAQAVWGAVPPAAGAEIGAVAVMLFGVVPGLLMTLAALARIRPSQAVVRGVVLVTGPPLRYALIVVMVWYAWTVKGQSPFLSIAAGLALVLVVPVAAVGLGALIYRRRA